jgi:hypothetical protein
MEEFHEVNKLRYLKQSSEPYRLQVYKSTLNIKFTL